MAQISASEAITHVVNDNFDKYLKLFPEIVQIKKQTEEQNKGFETMSLDKFMSAEFEPQFPLIENIMDKGTISLIAGDEGTGKSWVILSACLSLASGVPLFDFFEIHSTEDYDE